MRRETIISTVTMTVLIAILAVGALVGWRSLFAETPTSELAAPDATDTCADVVPAGKRLRTRQVQVSVYNGGDQPGLADDTMAALLRRGFIEGSVGNAPEDTRVRRVVVRAADPKNTAARLVARQFGKKVRVVASEDDLGPGVDVFVGNRFRKLAKVDRAIKVRAGGETCLPPTTSGES